jgi:hypothetical protein
VISVAPAYNLPRAAVGSATLVLNALSFCRMWRGNITHWSARSCGNKGRWAEQPEPPHTKLQQRSGFGQVLTLC